MCEMLWLLNLKAPSIIYIHKNSCSCPFTQFQFDVIIFFRLSDSQSWLHIRVTWGDLRFPNTHWDEMKYNLWGIKSKLPRAFETQQELTLLFCQIESQWKWKFPSPFLTNICVYMDKYMSNVYTHDFQYSGPQKHVVFEYLKCGLWLKKWILNIISFEFVLKFPYILVATVLGSTILDYLWDLSFLACTAGIKMPPYYSLSLPKEKKCNS